MNVSRNCAERSRWLLSVGLLLASSVKAAATAEPAAMPSVGRLLLGLLIVLGFLFAAAWLLRRGGVITGNSGAIRIVAQTPVGTRERLVLVQVGEQQLLVGVTAQQIQLLHTLTEPVALPANTGTNRFAEQLAAMMKGQRPS